jgi:hypothetical protein
MKENNKEKINRVPRNKSYNSITLFVNELLEDCHHTEGEWDEFLNLYQSKLLIDFK